MDYISTERAMINLGSPLLAYSSAYIVSTSEDYQVLAEVYEPYFSRTYEKYCSHRNTPNQTKKASYPAAVCNGQVAYIAHNIPQIYYDYGSSYHRDYFMSVLKKLLPHDVCQIDGLMSCGRMRLTENSEYYALHLFYASPVSRGEACVIEDIPELYNVKVTLYTDQKPGRIVKIPQNEGVDFTMQDGKIQFTVDKMKNHQLILIEKS